MNRAQKLEEWKRERGRDGKGLERNTCALREKQNTIHASSAMSETSYSKRRKVAQSHSARLVRFEGESRANPTAQVAAGASRRALTQESDPHNEMAHLMELSGVGSERCEPAAAVDVRRLRSTSNAWQYCADKCVFEQLAKRVEELEVECARLADECSSAVQLKLMHTVTQSVNLPLPPSCCASMPTGRRCVRGCTTSSKSAQRFVSTKACRSQHTPAYTAR